MKYRMITSKIANKVVASAVAALILTYFGPILVALGKGLPVSVLDLQQALISLAIGLLTAVAGWATRPSPNDGVIADTGTGPSAKTL